MTYTPKILISTCVLTIVGVLQLIKQSGAARLTLATVNLMAISHFGKIASLEQAILKTNKHKDL